MKKLIPIILVGIALLYTLKHTVPPKNPGAFDLNSFGRTPVLQNGRIQPIDTIARNALIQIAGVSKIPESKTRALEWFMELISDGEKADSRNIFRMHHPEIIKDLNLSDKGYRKKQLYWYSINDLRPHMAKIFDDAIRIGEIPAEKRSHQEQQIIEVANAVHMYQRLRVSFVPQGMDDLVTDFNGLFAMIPKAIPEVQKAELGQEHDEELFNTFIGTLEELEKAANAALPSVIPPAAGQPSEAWRPLPGAVMESMQLVAQSPTPVDLSSSIIPPTIGLYAQIQSAYKNQNADEFNKATESLHQIMFKTDRPHKAAKSEYIFGKIISATFGKAVNYVQKPSRKGKVEFFLNHLNPFACAQGTYMLAFLAALVYVIRPKWKMAWNTAIGMVLLAFIVHTAGITVRMLLEGRPPVTNLYSSAVFVGWGAILLAIFAELLFRNGLNLLGCTLIGYITLMVAHFLSLDGDTMAMLQAVLDTNAWLATHVTTVTFGYSATFVAGFMGLVYLAMGIATPLLTKDKRKMLGKVIYGIICFATLFSFVGTILGGIWADQSWGRFWGWDPKENGALLIVIWNATILHARWGGLIRERGLVNMAIFGNIVTAFSWFGTNLLGVGLHSYGFMDGTFVRLIQFCGSQILFIMIGVLLPTKYWLSYRAENKNDSSSGGNSDGDKDSLATA